MQPALIQSIAEMQNQALAWRAKGKRVGLAPTMGYLHEGHLSLMRLLRPRCDILVASIFVNPTQFGPNEDFSRYPRDLQRDLELCAATQCDVVFHPSTDEIYPANFRTHLEVSELTDHLCGPWRPGHFRGVTTIVGILFNLVQPHLAAFGQKDAQQALVIERMVRDLRWPIEIVIAPTVREPDGLAMSSRNVYLSPNERREATALIHSLQLAQELIRQGEKTAARVIGDMRRLLEREISSPVIEYVSIVDRESLQPIERIEGRFVIALAVRIGRTRLIDNMMFDLPK